MAYTFNLLGISPILHFFYHQQEVAQQPSRSQVEYVGAYQCTLDAFIASVETVPPEKGWKLDEAVDTVIQFWMNNSDAIHHWRSRLEDAGKENLLVARLADYHSLRDTFESLLG